MESQRSHKIGLDSFIIGEQLGEGAYSKVYICKKKDDNQLYAVKIVNKNFIQKEGKVRSVMAERDALLRFKHPFFTRLHYSFQDPENLYFVVQYCSGGDLATMIKSFFPFFFYLQETIGTRDSAAPFPSSSFTPRK
ncbi:uncharacterized protein [Blastocystis hominis]|uniref:non-specific serine/threonine protein kinase n=1 Tax=Blastocystis hominis TaxID=12968 RepID=D8M989_BLAHO|nr:uncharacterized protein [Blastocystis hominis]CBK24628.2 unnamed protein product [Blastocystis hominis]|eukprot:XP_012898676.1 uncharacterized protein [Blastocystis hominis]